MPILNPNSPQALAMFALVFAGFGLAGLFLWISKNAPLKRRLFPYIAAALGMLFLSAFLTAGMPIQWLYQFAPLVAVSVWLNIRAFQFCRSCGATIRGNAFFSRPKFCPKCGGALGP